jgi:hypothetical protein
MDYLLGFHGGSFDQLTKHVVKRVELASIEECLVFWKHKVIWDLEWLLLRLLLRLGLRLRLLLGGSDWWLQCRLRLLLLLACLACEGSCSVPPHCFTLCLG